MLQIVRPAACQKDNLTITNGTLKALFQRPAPIRHYIGINLSPNKTHNQRQPMLELPILNNANITTPKDQSTMMPTPLIRSKPSLVSRKPPSRSINRTNITQPYSDFEFPSQGLPCSDAVLHSSAPDLISTTSRSTLPGRSGSKTR